MQSVSGVDLHLSGTFEKISHIDIPSGVGLKFRRMAKINSECHPFSSAVVLFTALALTLLMSLLYPVSTASLAGAVPDEARWSVVDIPAGGEAGGWVLAGGSSLKHLTMTGDGTLYCYANPSGTSYTLYKSSDGGFSWASAGRVTETIVDIAAAPGAGIIYYATESDIYKSVDAGSSFDRLPPAPGGAGTGNVTITCIDVVRPGNSNIVAAGTSDSDTSEYGGVYSLDESELLPAWLDTGMGGYDVRVMAYSPDFASDRQLVAVVTDEQDTFVTSKVGDGDWSQVIGDAGIEGLVPVSAAIAFPDNYDVATEDSVLFVAIDTASDSGDVYKVSVVWAPGSSTAIDLDVGAAYNLSGLDVTGLDVSGSAADAILLAGAAGSTQVYRSTDGGVSWRRSSKEPTGQSDTCLLMAPDFASSGTAYVVTGGIESAFSRTTDGGVTWNQAGLIDTGISGSSIIDLAVSPDYDRDGTLFMLTFDGAHTEYSLWRSMNAGERWERVYSSILDEVDSISLVELSPGYGDDSRVMFLAGASNGDPAIWKSTDNGRTFLCLRAPYSVDIWAAVDDDTLFFGSYNGSSGLVYSTINGGLSYSTDSTEVAAVGSQPLASMALSPDYEQDGTILVGNTDGWVYYSSDNGTSFRPLPVDAASAPLDGSITVAFDSDFAKNNTVYAVSSTADKGVYRFKIDRSTEWERVDGNLPVGGTLGQTAVSAGGVLYAVNSQPVDDSSQEGGMERSLNPSYSLGPTFETVTTGLDDGATLSGLWLRDNQLWSFDTQNTRLMTYIDSLTRQVALSAPLDEAPGMGTRDVMLDWETLSGATEYEWQLDYDTDFSAVPSDFESSTRASSVRLPDLDLDTTYYWRVRASEPVLSRWSDKWSFNTALGSSVYAPELLIPKAGAVEVLLKPLFQWTALSGAESYELLVSQDASFSSPIILKISEYALPSTAWQSDVSLDYNTTYYWKIRAGGSGSYSDWSAVSVFTTELPSDEESPSSELPPLSSTPLLSSPSPSPELPSPPPSPSPSTPEVQQAFPEWMMYLGGALLLTIVILLVTLLVMVAGIRRP